MKSDLVISSYILILLANTLNSTIINNLVIPEVVQSGTDAILDCQYYVPDDNFVIQWLFNGKNQSFFKWSPHHRAPEVSGILEGHLDLLFNGTLRLGEKGTGIRIVRVEPYMTGEYTCVLESNGFVTSETKTMLVYSTEQELDLNIDSVNKGVITIACVARGVYPQPDLILEYNNELISQQYQRVWQDRDLLYAIKSTTKLAINNCEEQHIEVKCRLCLPQVDYTAIKKRYLHLEADDCNCAGNQNSVNLCVLFTIFIVTLGL